MKPYWLLFITAWLALGITAMQAQANEYNPRLVASAYSDELISSLNPLLADFTSFAITAPTVIDREGFDASTLGTYPETPAELVPNVPVIRATIISAELAHRGEAAVQAGLDNATDRLIWSQTNRLALQGFLDAFEANGMRVTDADGNVIDNPNWLNVVAFARRELGDEMVNGFVAQNEQFVLDNYGRENMLQIYENSGFRNISYVRGLFDGMNGQAVEMDMFIYPENYPEAEIQNLFATLEDAAHCVREGDVTHLQGEELQAALDECEAYGRTVARILVQAPN